MDLNKFIADVHKNAVNHGWWDEGMDFDKVVTLVHSEWSEALEEYRAGRDMVWYDDDKPEGIAVELIDGCLRILDYMGDFADNHPGVTIFAPDADTIDKIVAAGLTTYRDKLPDNLKSMAIDEIVCLLHFSSSMAWGEKDEDWLMNAMVIALCWMHEKGLDPEAIMLAKHRYNETRPYRHGGKKM